MIDALHEFLRRLPTTDFYVELPFWGYLAAAVLLYRLVPATSTLRPWALLLTSAAMLLALPRFDLSMLGVLAAMCGATFGFARLLTGGMAGSRDGARRAVAAAAIVAILSILAFFKYAFLQRTVLSLFARPESAPGGFIFLIGISYSSFKAMHFVIEAYKKSITKPGFVEFLNYMLFFPSFISGPINRFTHFCENSAAARQADLRSDLGPGLERVVRGLFKKTVLTVILLPYTLTGFGVPLADMAAWQMLVGMYVYAFYFYFDFSGYTDLAIGGARLMGFVLPENFQQPFLKKNIQQLWANWHISLTSWLTDYVYWPLVRAMRNSPAISRHPVLLSNIAIIITFIVCGIWHGDTLNFIIWGLYHGLGIAAVNTYQSWKRKVRHPLARKYFTSTFSRVAGTVVTFNFFAIGLTPFVLTSEQIATLVQRFL